MYAAARPSLGRPSFDTLANLVNDGVEAAGYSSKG